VENESESVTFFGLKWGGFFFVNGVRFSLCEAEAHFAGILAAEGHVRGF